jgi:hypothetical protein
MDGSGKRRAGAGLWPEVGEDPDVRALPVSAWRDRAAYPFGGDGKWAVGSFSDRAESDTAALFLFSLFLSLFFFQFSLFLPYYLQI